MSDHYKELPELWNFVNTLPKEIVDEAWGAGFFVLLRVEDYQEVLIPRLVNGENDEEWLCRLKLFVASYSGESKEKVN